LKRARAVIVALVLAAGAGCQWVLPLHEDDRAGDASTAHADGGGALDGTTTTTDGSAEADARASDGAPLPPPPGTDASCDNAYTGRPGCDTCLNAKCCPEMSACFVTNPECIAILQCLTTCGFDFITCPQACRDKHDAGTADFDRANNCSELRCHYECLRDAG
jgi:hypothetical protein